MRHLTGQTRAIKLAALCGVLVGILFAGQASAKPYSPYAYKGTFPAGSFTGQDAVGGTHPFDETIRGIDVNQNTGDIYVGAESAGGQLYKFDSTGASQPFSALAPNTAIAGVPIDSFGDTLVDNSGTSAQGRIYQYDVGSPFKAFLPSGEELNASNGFPRFPLNLELRCGADVAPNGNLWITSYPTGVQEYDQSGNPTSEGPAGGFIPAELACLDVMDSQENMYVDTLEHGEVSKWDKNGKFLGIIAQYGADPQDMEVDRSDDHLFVLTAGGTIAEYDAEGGLVETFGGPEPSRSYPGLNVSNLGGGIGINETTHEIYSPSRFPNRVDVFAPATPVTIPDVVAEGTTNLEATGATLQGSVDTDAAHGGTEIVSCEFKWGPAPNELSNSTSCEQTPPFSGKTSVTAPIGGLTLGTTYFFRVTAKNSGNGIASSSKVASFQAADPPVVTEGSVSKVHGDGATLSGRIDPRGGKTTYQFEYGPTEAYGSSAPLPESELPNNVGNQAVSQLVTGLDAGTLYHFRISATNANTTTRGSDHTFTTFPFAPVLEDRCQNAHVRQQVSAALLPDCRAYELVSAADTGGYDVESDLVAGEKPFGGYPDAQEGVLYGIHNGAIPGPWNPTNRGVDPYIATRGSDAWHTTYAGIPANNPFATGPFASELDEASADLGTLAFGGPGICSPCFADGSTGIPVRGDAGDLVQGMAGTGEPGPAAQSDGLVNKRFSADGTHLIFGSTSLFASGGNDETGDVSIYDRDLNTGQTQVVSTNPSGDSLDCLQGAGQCHSPGDEAGIAELDVSRDGSRILVGQLVSTDSAGNRYFHLYMHVGSNPHTIDLMPGATSGALFDGMTDDGATVYFTTKSTLTTSSDQDSDSSADIFRADVSSGGATVTRVSVGSGGAGNTDSCNPVANATNEHWNSVTGTGDCGAVAIGGGGGVAAKSGAIYFLSPELLDGAGNGTQDAPNLYVDQPGSAPRFVVTLESILTAPVPPTKSLPYHHSFGGTPTPPFIAVDASGGPSQGDVYVADTSANVIRKYDPAGNLITGWGNNGVLDGSTTNEGPFRPIRGIAVGSDGTLYVDVAAFSFGNSLFEFAQDGTFTAEKYVEAGPAGLPFGISVDPSGNVFLTGFRESIRRFDNLLHPGSTTLITEFSHNEAIPKSGFAVDPHSGDLYIGLEIGGAVARYSFDSKGRVLQNDAPPCGEECPPTGKFAVGKVAGATGFAVDPSDGGLYVDKGDRILHLGADEQPVRGPDIGIGNLNHSTGLAVAGDGSVYAVTATPGGYSVAAFGPPRLLSEPRIDNPAVIDAVNDAGTRHTADFQVSPDGSDAAFSAGSALTGYDNDGFSEVFRYDVPTDTLACASCNPTGARAIGAASMAAHGLSLTHDGRVFFNSNDALAPRDLDERQDAYEWSGGPPQLISTGSSPFDSSLLTASADGKNTYFFTRDTLVPQDKNGTLAKIYDAREDGGFPFPPEPVPCKASDECHGAGSIAAGPLPIGTITGTRGNAQPVPKCRKGFMRRGDRCVKKKRRHHRNRRHRR